MKSAYLMPYCPLPVDTGGKTEMWKHLEVLKGLGECRIISAKAKPVGCGWTDDYRSMMENDGVELSFRENECRRTLLQISGIGYAALFKSFGMDKAFGHSNPYHRYAFAEDWWKRQTGGMDIAVINYSYWAWLPCACPKVVVLHDLLSEYMWEGSTREAKELSSADLVVVISKEEERKLNAMGITKTLWSPPAVKSESLPLTNSVGLIGSANKFNIEGLRWLEKATFDVQINVYGGVSRYVIAQNFRQMGRYAESLQPYRDCGIILLTTSGGMGVQIKAIESLAYGRAIVARKGAMRGLPNGRGAWVEVETPKDMLAAVRMLKNDAEARLRLSGKAKAYYSEHLDSRRINRDLSEAYVRISNKSTVRNHEYRR